VALDERMTGLDALIAVPREMDGSSRCRSRHSSRSGGARGRRFTILAATMALAAATWRWRRPPG
jgi:hypothetical protein